MTIIAAPSANQVESTLAASYTRGTDTTITLVDGTLFPSPTPLGHVLWIRDTEKVTAATKWCLIIYTSKSTHVLTMGGGATDFALAKNVTVGDEAYEWPIGSIVELVASADEIAKQFSLNDALSPMIVTGGALSTGSTPGTFKVTALTCFLRLTNDEDGKLGKFDLAEQDDQAITAADTTYYVILTYDGDATPTLSHSATRPTDYRSIVIGKVMKTTAPITHVLTTGCRLLSGVEALARRAKDLRGLELASGCAIAWNDDVADNEITIQEGIAYQGIVRITPFSADAFNSNDDDFVYMWRDTGTWQYTTGSKVINALYFDDNTVDAGHPGGTLVTGQYGVAWVYIHPSDDDVYVVYGRDSYKLAEAEAAQAPSDIPVILSDFGLLIGRIIIVKSGTTFQAIDMVTDTFFSGAGVGDDPFAIHDNEASEILGIAQDTAPIGTHEILSENAAGTKKAIPIANLAYGNPPLGQAGSASWNNRTYEGYEIVDTATEYTIGAAGGEDFANLAAAAAVLKGLILVETVTLKLTENVSEAAAIIFNGIIASGGYLIIDLDTHTHTVTGDPVYGMLFSGQFLVKIIDGTLEFDPSGVQPMYSGVGANEGAFLWLTDDLTMDGKDKGIREMAGAYESAQIFWEHPTTANVNVATVELRIDKATAFARNVDPASTTITDGGIFVSQAGLILTKGGTITPV